MTAHLDTFARDNLPPRAQWPDFLFELPESHARSGSCPGIACCCAGRTAR